MQKNPQRKKKIRKENNTAENSEKYFRVYGKISSLGPAYALGQSSFFKKYERNDFSNLCPSLIEKIRFPFYKKIDLIFKRKK